MENSIVEPIVTVAGILIGAAVSIYQIRRALPSKRSSLHHDLETLKLAVELKIPADALRNEIIQRMAKLEPDYESPKWHITGEVIYMSIFGLVWALGFGYWTYYLSSGSEGFSWWSVLTGFFAFSGLMQPFVAFSEQQEKDERAVRKK